MPIDQYKSLTPDGLANALIQADDEYYNDGESFLTDAEYDELRHHLEKTLPTHPYLGRIGSPTRGDKIKLPVPMGGMQQIYEGDLADWLDKYDIKNVDVTVGDKLDGTSALLIYGKDGHFQSAYSRGEGTEASDITRHMRNMPSVPMRVSGPMIVRGENIIPIAAFDEATQIIKKGDGSTYKTLRGMVAGVMNSLEKPAEIYPLIDFLAYRVIQPVMGRKQQKALLEENGFNVGYVVSTKANKLSEAKLESYLATRRQSSKYEIDGLVISVEDAALSQKINQGMREGSLNELSMVKFKVNNQFALSTVTHVEWNNSKHGIAKPTIVYEPVSLGTVTASRASGMNAKFILDNGIGPGAKIKLVRSGDVIPNIHEVIEKVKPQMPEGDYVWSINLTGEKGVDLVMRNTDDDIVVLAKKMTDFFDSIGTPFLKDANIIKLINADMDSIEKVVNADRDSLVSVIGINGGKAYDVLHAKLQDIQLYELMGATVLFGRGMGERKFKKLQSALGVEGILSLSDNDADIIRGVPGFDDTAAQIIENMPAFRSFLASIESKVQLAEEKSSKQLDGLPLSGQKFVFTGFRDKALELLVAELGGEIADSVSKKTQGVVTDDVSSQSGKIKKARDLGIDIYERNEFSDKLAGLSKEPDDQDDSIRL